MLGPDPKIFGIPDFVPPDQIFCPPGLIVSGSSSEIFGPMSLCSALSTLELAQLGFESELGNNIITELIYIITNQTATRKR